MPRVNLNSEALHVFLLWYHSVSHGEVTASLLLKKKILQPLSSILLTFVFVYTARSGFYVSTCHSYISFYEVLLILAAHTLSLLLLIWAWRVGGRGVN